MTSHNRNYSLILTLVVASRLTLMKPTKQLSPSGYLSKVYDLEARSIMPKLRIDTNTLQSCRSRRKSTPTDNSEECQLCHRGREDVKHFLIMCPYFTLERQHLLEQLKSHFPAFDNSSPEQKLSFILNAGTL